MYRTRNSIVFLLVLVLSAALSAQDSGEKQPEAEKPKVEATAAPEKKEPSEKEEAPSQKKEEASETSGDENNAQQPVVEKKAVEEEPVKEKKKEKSSIKAVVQPAKKVKTITEVAPQAHGDGLLEAHDPRVTYGRIPGIVLKKSADSGFSVMETGSEPIDLPEVAAEKKEPFSFRLKSETTDLLAKISIIVLILLIVLLYMIKNNRSKRRIFK